MTAKLVRLAPYSPEHDRVPPVVHRIWAVTAKAYGVAVGTLLSKGRHTDVAVPRFVIAYLLRQLTDYSTTQIAWLLDYADHTTVLYAVDRVRALRAASRQDAAFIHDIIRDVRSGDSTKAATASAADHKRRMSLRVHAPRKKRKR